MIIGKCHICGEEMRIGSDMTNADRIRSMTDEEMAKEIAVGQLWCEIVCGETDFVCDGACEQHVLKWLKEEVKE